MRPIKFRAWIDGEMIYIKGDVYIEFFDDPTCVDWCITHRMDERTIYSHDPSYEFKYKNNVLMQFTGLTDRNGKEIYEGDIVGNDGKCFYRVVFENAAFVCYHTDLTNWDGRPLRWGLLSRFFEMEDIFHVEVIGNIYENPELL